MNYQETGERAVTASYLEELEKLVRELTAEKDESLRMLYGRDEEIERLTAENERLSGELSDIKEAIDGKLKNESVSFWYGFAIGLSARLERFLEGMAAGGRR